MAVTISKPVKIGQRSFSVGWSSSLTTPTFYVYQDGLLISTTQLTEQVFTVEAGESLIVEVLDSPTEAPITAFPGKLTIGWYSSAGAASYRVEELILGAWTLRADITDNGQGFFRWKTRFLEDVTVHQFRVVPVGTNGNNGTPLVFSAIMVRHPDPPEQNFIYSDVTKKVTVS